MKEVAIKVIRPGFSDRSDFIQMFIQEARLASKLSHANIVQVFDFDQVDGLDIWLGARVKNEEATAAFLHLGDIPPDQRTRTLQEASRKAGIADSDCPMALLDESWSEDGFRRLLKEGKATPGQ